MKDSVIRELTEYMLERLDLVDKEYTSASSRTSQYKKIANKIHKNLTASVSPNSYHTYLTTLRNEIKKTNRKHHALTSTTNRKGYLVNVIKKLPAYSDDLKALATLPAETIGSGKDKILGKLQTELKNDELDTAYDLVKGLLIDHQLVTYLTKSNAKKDARARSEEASLRKKSSNVKVYNIPALLKLADKLLDDGSYTSVAWALALLTGRRSTEILLRGKFSKVSDDSVMFSGQLKKRKGTQKAPYLIPTLAPADRIISALNRLRGMDGVSEFRNDSEYRLMDYDQLNKAVNQRASGVLNAKAKRLMDDSNEVFKNTRGIYARHTSDTVRKSSPNWEGLNEDEFLKAILGHESTDEVKHYRQVELKSEVNKDWLKVPEPEEEKEEKEQGEQVKQNWRATSPIKKMREAISDFKEDHVMVAIGKASRKVSIKSVIEFHDEKLRFWVAENPTLKITQSAIEKNKGNTLKSGTGSVDVRVNRGTFKAWESIVGADALETYNESKE